MTLYTARALLIQDRMDWTKPHLRWIHERAYRLFRNRKR